MEQCKIAVSNNGLALQYVPLELQSDEIYLEALTETFDALKYIPIDKQDKYIKVVDYIIRKKMCM